MSRVYSLLDENEAILEERVEYGDPGTMLRPLIEDLLPDAARVVVSSAPLSKVDGCRHLVSLPAETGGEGGMSTVMLPGDFLRLVYLRMSDWRVGVTVPLASGGEEHQMRLRRHRDASRRRISPAVAIRYCGDRRMLEVFGSASGSTVAQLDYLPVPRIEGQYIDLPPALVPDVCAKTAEMVYAVIG